MYDSILKQQKTHSYADKKSEPSDTKWLAIKYVKFTYVYSFYHNF